MHIVILMALTLLTACAAPRTPMPSHYYPGSEAAQNQNGKKLLVALRGMGGSEKSFEKHGFIAALQQQYPEFDVVAPDAHFGYYRKRSITERLSVDIIDPAIAEGYEEIWLAGVSLGGFGSLVYLRCCEEKITGVVLISPFSGKRKLHDAVNAYLDGTQGPPWSEADRGQDSLLGLWQWMVENKQILNSGRVWLGYGVEDKLSGHALLARLVDDQQVARLSGGHKVEVFMRIWNDILARDPMGPPSSKVSHIAH